MGTATSGIHTACRPTLTAAKLAIALGLIIAFMAVEVTVGVLASSLALLSDAAHMLTDATAIGLSLVAIRLAQRPAKGAMTFGLKLPHRPDRVRRHRDCRRRHPDHRI